jgi:2-keto-4-pentenoate hydratase/2-oxohepta-3-ene-1,7-dioic acid hydratase in catechol pathway
MPIMPGRPTRPIPQYPELFNKFANALIGPGEPIVLPRVSQQVDYEAELAVVIGKPGRYIDEQRALEHVAGYTVLNDVLDARFQFRGRQWCRGRRSIARRRSVPGS